MARRPPGQPLRIQWRLSDSAEMLRLRDLQERDPRVRMRLHLLWRVRAGEVYADLAAKQALVEGWLRDFVAKPVRVRSLTAWPWLLEQIRLVS